VVNDVAAGRAFGSPDNAAVILSADGTSLEVPLGSKERLAAVLMDEVADRLAGTVPGHTMKEQT
jgi:phosphopantothenoylcysteine decarboxylase/phosphopantothenate--cysteine ligase